MTFFLSFLVRRFPTASRIREIPYFVKICLGISGHFLRVFKSVTGHILADPGQTRRQGWEIEEARPGVSQAGAR